MSMQIGTKTSNSEVLDVTCLAAGTVAADMRHRIGMRLATWHHGHLTDDVLLVADELIVNACGVTPDREIRVLVAREAQSVLVAVWDSSDERPAARPVGDVDVSPDPRALEPGHLDGTTGRGLIIVQALATECGVTTTRPSGKWCWARFSARPRGKVSGFDA